MKFHKQSITFNEVPGEISLVYSITGCGGRCKGCHSPFLHDGNNGTELTDEFYLKELSKYQNQATCVVFLGGDWYEDELVHKLKLAKQLGFKTALYSGKEYDQVSRKTKYNLNYIKTGRYIEGLGGLESIITNQRFYKLKPKQDITHLFWPQAKPR